MEMRDIDAKEEEICKAFFRDGCGCSEQCQLKFSEDHMRAMRNDMASLTSTSLDMVVMGQVSAHTHCGDTIGGERWRKRSRPRVHSVGSFYHHGQKICKHTFLFLHCMGKSRYKAIKESYLKHGIQSR